MTVSPAFKAAVFAQETSEAFLVLLTIDHDDFVEPLRFTSNGVDTVSNGDTFLAFPFRFIPPSDDDSDQQAKLEIDNVDRRIVEAIRRLSSPPTISVNLVRESAPDTIEVEFPEFLLQGVKYDRLVVSGTLSVESLDNDPIPAHSFMPSFFPGLFGY